MALFKKQVYEEICRELKEKEGFSRQVSFVTVDRRRSQDFYTLFVQEEIKVEFEIENTMQESFVTLNQGNESVSIEQFVLTASQYLL